MKKILSLLLALAMMLTISVTAFADDINNDSENKSGSTDITYTANESYVVTIPDSMTIGTDATVSASNVTLAKDRNLAVSVSSTQYNNGWKLKNGDDTIGYTLKIGDTDVANNGKVLTVKSGETASTTLKTALTETAKYSGTYTDTLTFTVAVTSPAEELKTALTTALQAGTTNLDITLASDADDTMFEAIREALKENNTTVSLTIRGAKTIPNGFLGERMKTELAVDAVTSIDLPDAITIGDDAFNYCHNLTSVNAPKATTVGEKAFCGTGLTTVDLPEATTVNFGAFMSCQELTSVKLPKATSIGNRAFQTSSNIQTLELTAEGDITLGSSVFGVSSNNFSHNVELTLNSDKQSTISGTTWNGYTFKSISFVDTTT